MARKNFHDNIHLTPRVQVENDQLVKYPWVWADEEDSARGGQDIGARVHTVDDRLVIQIGGELNADASNRVDLNREDAIAFLKQALTKARGLATRGVR